MVATLAQPKDILTGPSARLTTCEQIYYWIENFPTLSACNLARSDAIGDGWLASNGWYNCEQLATGQYQFQYTRKPTTARGSPVVGQSSGYAPGGDIVALEKMTPDSVVCYIQEQSGSIFRRTGFEQVTAGLNKWNDDVLKSLGYTFKLSEVFAASRACQAAVGDPFIPNKVPASAFYPSMRLKDDAQGNGGESEILSGTMPQCLFNLPIFEVGNPVLDQWCRTHMGEEQTGQGWKQGNRPCSDDLEWWAIQSDTKVCASNQGSYQSPVAGSTPRISRAGLFSARARSLHRAVSRME